METERERDKKTIYIYIQTRLLSVLAGPFKGLNYFDRKPYNGVTLPPIPLYDSSTISRRVCLPSGEAKKKLFTMASIFFPFHFPSTLVDNDIMLSVGFSGAPNYGTPYP